MVCAIAATGELELRLGVWYNWCCVQKFQIMAFTDKTRRRRLFWQIAGLSFLGLVFSGIFLFFLSLGPKVNSYGWMTGCEKKLNRIGKGLELYRRGHGGQYPEAIMDLKPYLQGDLSVTFPVHRCVGERDGGSGQYVYDPNVSPDKHRPICWDNKPHNIGRRNVLFSDGSVKKLRENASMQLMERYSVENPNTPRRSYPGW